MGVTKSWSVGILVSSAEESGIKAPMGSWSRECRVTPPALRAAIPVGAATIQLL